MRVMGSHAISTICPGAAFPGAFGSVVVIGTVLSCGPAGRFWSLRSVQRARGPGYGRQRGS
ncbi:hypothetical protein GCM10010191_85700 [Actinomadura vinacea]|uniref:Uncharacterized protein n=1 Tax=Actinomadura vinacea TaxID=115336 RepID=A0ABN3KA43_9ACTN